MFTKRDSDEYYSALAEACGDLGSDQLAMILADAGLTNPGTQLQSISAHVRAARNPNRNEFFKVAELVAITRATGSLAIVRYINKATGCLAPERDLKADRDESLLLLRNRQRQIQSEYQEVTYRISQIAKHEADDPEDRILFSQEQAEG